MLYEQYLVLNQKLRTRGTGDVSIEVTVKSIAEILFCTTRNAKLVIRKMTEQGWINFVSGRGRGNRSRLTFLVDREEMLITIAKDLARKGQFKQAFEMLHTHGEQNSIDQFSLWLDGYFGLEKEHKTGSETKDVLRIPIYRPINTMDPADCFCSLSAHMIQQLYDRLVIYDINTERFIPALAHHWESNEDATEWTFHLRKGVLFHNGTKLTSEDVRFTMERLALNRRNSWILRSLKQIEVLSSHAIRFVLYRPNWIFLRFVTAVSMSILPKDYAGLSEEEYWKHPIGTGPFQFAEWTEGCFTMNAHPYYYQGRPYLDSVIVATLPEEAGIIGGSSRKWSCLNSLTAESVMDTSAAALDTQAPEDIKPLDNIGSEHYCTGLLTWNMTKEGSQQTAQFRHAVNLYLDRARMIQELGEHRSHPAHSFLADNRYSRQAHHVDEQYARALLKESGYDGSPLVIGSYGLHVRDAEWIRGRLADLNIEAIVVAKSMTNILEDHLVEELDCIIHSVVLPGEEVCLVENYEQHGSYVKELLDPGIADWVHERIDRALACKWADERMAMLEEVEEYLRREAHVLFLNHSSFQIQSDASFKGVAINSLGWIDFKEIWKA
ncbi:ABC transporter substrate-binding protein [Paenibacillus provencensis]|uniref:ABC transporter substrate-binding protein n=1 Tax=Paenibacillus provencensis TaxID=441151 RepID=A0ABW3PRY2_9BACL|nr:ABC transporter substrate-binding protein [Paenibacillus sp. MER 78]MCM3129050.1 ABC transporter substrate-binding protein [Paenibacillus sp. MER 78]